MISGEEIAKNSDSSDAAAANRFDAYAPLIDRQSDSDNSPSRSNYSSCGESEFERYCSANSVIGTASFCSSVGNHNDFLGSDFGSFRKLSFGAEDCVLDSSDLQCQFAKSLGNRQVAAAAGSFDCPSESRSDLNSENRDLEFGFLSKEAEVSLETGKQPNFSRCGVNSPSVKGNCGGSSENNLIQTRIETEQKLVWNFVENSETYDGIFEDLGNENADNGILLGGAKIGEGPGNYQSHDVISIESHGGNLMHQETPNGLLSPGYDENAQSGADVFDEENIENLSGRENGTIFELDGETSSRYEHSDVDDSMLDYGTDDEERKSLCRSRNLQYLQDKKERDENPLLINSSVAFGSDDWDEFMEETKENNVSDVFSDKPFKQQQKHLDIENNLLTMSESALMVHAGALVAEGAEREEDVRDIPVASCQVQPIEQSIEDLEGHSVGNGMEDGKDSHSGKPLVEKTLVKYSVLDSLAIETHLNINDPANERELKCVCSEGVAGPTKESILDKEQSGASELSLDPLSDATICNSHLNSSEAFQGNEKVSSGEDRKLDTCLQSAETDSPDTTELSKENLASDKIEKLDVDEFYDEMVLEMEEILLDSVTSQGARFPQSNRGSLSERLQTSRDGGSTASTSGADNPYSTIPFRQKIDWVEVIGAKQKRGDVSLGERLVGVKEYTVYVIRVWSGKDQWDVERRYRDFFTLFRQLKSFFADHGWNLPPPWSSVERESRKIFGNASPNVISERSTLIQECIRSILQFGPVGTPSTLVWFLSPCKDPFSPSIMKTKVPQSMQIRANNGNPALFYEGASTEGGSLTLGKTISLLVEVQPRKSMKQLLESQYYMCAGCHKPLDVGKTLMHDLVQTFGWGKPRLCEYAGQLFCASCHTNDTAVLPARVLHHWDFALYPVSQLAKAYLESIYDQPMLCISAVNPFLFSKVPALLHVMGIRKKIGAMFPYLRCPFRRSIQRGLGARRYLLESTEFFALRDLVDLSKGAFAALPVLVENISRKILEHITQQCLVCCDVGIPCSARQACEDPSSLIFPFQESEITRCSLCNSVFHKSCFHMLVGCPCGTPAEAGHKPGLTEHGKHRDGNELDGFSDASAGTPSSKLAVGFFSDLWRPKKQNPVILMGSFPGTAL